MPKLNAPLPTFVGLATVALLFAILDLGQEVLVPFALAVTLAFVLTPGVKLLERRLGRGLAVALVAVAALAVVAGVASLLNRQLVDLAGQMDRYSESMRAKVAGLRGGDSPGLGGLTRTLDRLLAELDEKVDETRGARPVKVVPDAETAAERIRASVEPVLTPLAKGVVVMVLTLFMLARREDLRDRFLRLVGRRRLSLTTRTVDEAGARISRFLLVQAAINAGFGLVITVGLFLIGIPYAPLWGFLAAVLRFIPFVGSLVAMVLPVLVAFALFEGWWPTLATLGLFIGVDVLAAYLVEPLVIGHRTGVSSFALLVSTVVWTWLWGASGLLLSTPITVCLAVLGKQIRELEFLSVLLGDEPALEPELGFYQRLLAGDEEEACALLERRLAGSTPQRVLDLVVIPAVARASRDHAAGDLSREDYQSVLRSAADVVADALGAPNTPSGPIALTPRASGVLALPAQGDGDALLADLTRHVIPPQARFERLGSEVLASEVASRVEAQRPQLVIIAALPGGRAAQIRYLHRRLRQVVPPDRILVLHPTGADDERGARLARDEGLRLYTTLGDAQRSIESLLLLDLPETAATPAPAPVALP